MKLDFTWKQAAEAAGGTVIQGYPDRAVGSIATDTRTLKAGDAFLALKGEKFDAHDFELQAAEKGAAGFIVERRSNRVPVDATVLKVGDTLKALQDLAAWHRRRFPLTVVAVTGSNGKTTTKQLARAVCAAAGPTVASEGNKNNQIGLPLSLLEIGPEHRYGVFEFGDSHFGDLALLARLAKPDAAVITNVGAEHLEFFGDLDGVYRSKLELVEALPAGAPVVLNADDPYLGPLARRLGDRAVTFGESASARVRFSGGALQIGSARIPVDADKVPYPLNAAAAAALGVALGLSPERIAKGLAAYEAPPLRMELRRHPSGATLVVDAYNANPVSMKGALEYVCARWPKERKVAVLGDMKELGAASPGAHRELGALLKGLPLSAAFLAGPEMAPGEAGAAGAAFPVRYAAEPGAWLEALKAEAKPGAVILLKASRAMAFEKLVEKL